MSAEGSGHPLTPGRLRNHLELSSAGTSYVIDRLVEAGHVERARDDPEDRRIVHLRYTATGQQIALAFFGPLGTRAEAAMDQFTHDELVIVARFLDVHAQGMGEHLRQLAARPPVDR